VSSLLVCFFFCDAAAAANVNSIQCSSFLPQDAMAPLTPVDLAVQVDQC